MIAKSTGTLDIQITMCAWTKKWVLGRNCLKNGRMDTGVVVTPERAFFHQVRLFADALVSGSVKQSVNL